MRCLLGVTAISCCVFIRVGILKLDYLPIENTGKRSNNLLVINQTKYHQNYYQMVYRSICRLSFWRFHYGTVFVHLRKQAITMRFTNKVCLITGAGSGIGRATAIQMAANGGSVLVLDIDESKAAETTRRKLAAVEGNLLNILNISQPFKTKGRKDAK